jgi:hypothetical protein
MAPVVDKFQALLTDGICNGERQIMCLEVSVRLKLSVPWNVAPLIILHWGF